MRNNNIIYIALAILAITLFPACSGIRNCSKPELNLPESLAGNSTDTITLADVEWWKVYTDSALIHIIDETLAFNKDFQIAAAKIEELQQLYGLTASNYFPEISARLYGNNETNDYYGKKEVRDPEYGLKATMSWEIDLWGQLKWARRKGKANFEASVEDYRALRVSLIAEAASAYFSLIALDNELAIVKRTLFTRSENLKKAKLRFEGGLTPETVYQQAIVECATTEALIPGLEKQIAIQKNALMLLMGRYPEQEIARGKLILEQSIPDSIPVGIPSTLLKRRPDIRKSEAQLQAALANVGVVYADRFPRFSINLTGGLENDELHNFFQSPFTYILGNIAGSVFDFGRNRKKHKAAVAQYDQAKLAYEKTVLVAFHEVDNAVTSFAQAKATSKRRQELREAAMKYAQLAYAQYNMGAINYIDVLDAQRRYFDAQIGVSNATRDEFLALTNLYKALGGGW